jgi:uncharacterized membrane protein YhfC
MVIFRNKDLTALVPADQAHMLQTQIAAFWSAPWYYTLREAIEQIFVLTIQVSLAVMILQTFIRKQWFWVLLAISFHTMVEAARIIVLNLSNETFMNGVLGIFAILSVLLILKLRPKKNTDVNSSSILEPSMKDIQEIINKH